VKRLIAYVDVRVESGAHRARFASRIALQNPGLANFGEFI